MIRTLLAVCLLAAPALAHDWAPSCDTEVNYKRSRPSAPPSSQCWWRPDQKRDTKRDEPEHAPRRPHARSVGAGRQHGYCPPVDEDVRKRELAQWLSPADDPVGYRGVCELHHQGPPCWGNPAPLPEWVPDSPDELGWDHPIKTLRQIDRKGR